MKTAEWRALVRKLRKHFPIAGPVTVCRRKVKSDCGSTTFDGSSYHIRVNSNQSDQGQIDTLLHEWAHVSAIEEAYEHLGRWATLHGEIYNAWVNEFMPTESKV